jgi:hypothetical protein
MLDAWGNRVPHRWGTGDDELGRAGGYRSRHPLAVSRLPYTGIRLTRDSWVSVMYAEDLHSAKSAVTFQGTDRHDILGQQSADFQVSV